MPFKEITWEEIKSKHIVIQSEAQELATRQNELFKLIQDNIELIPKLSNLAQKCAKRGKEYHNISGQLDECWKKKDYIPGSSCAKFFKLIQRKKYNSTQQAVEMLYSDVGAEMRAPGKMALTEQMIQSIYTNFTNGKKFNFKNYSQELQEYENLVKNAINNITHVIHDTTPKCRKLKNLLPKIQTELTISYNDDKLKDQIAKIDQKIKKLEAAKNKIEAKLSKTN